MKVYKRHIKFLQILNLISALVIFITIIYAWLVLCSLPEHILIPEDLDDPDMSGVNKNVIWEDIRLMVTIYLIFSLITVFIEVSSFRYSSGFHMAQMVSILNLSICLVFAFTIIRTVWQVSL